MVFVGLWPFLYLLKFNQLVSLFQDERSFLLVLHRGRWYLCKPSKCCHGLDQTCAQERATGPGLHWMWRCLTKICHVWVRFSGWLCLKVYVKCAAIQCLWNYEPKSSKWLRCLLHQRFQKLRSRGYLWSHMDHTRIIVCFGSRCNKASPGRGCFPWYNRPTLADRDRPPWRKVSIAQTGGWVVVDFVVVLMHWVWARWKRYSTKAMEAVDTRPLDPFIEIPSNFLEDWFNFRKDVSI